MPVITGLFTTIVFFALVTVAFPLDITVERLENTAIYLCPACEKSIRPGDMHEHAELMVTDALTTGLDARKIAYSEGKGEDPRLSVLIFRFQERRGSKVAVEKPASVGFHAHVYRGNALIKTAVFDETQQPLSENVLKLFTFIKRGGKWITADQLCREGIERVLDEVEEDLR